MSGQDIFKSECAEPSAILQVASHFNQDYCHEHLLDPIAATGTYSNPCDLQLVDEFLSSQGPSCNLASSYQIDDYYNFGNDERNNMMSNPFNYDYDSSESQVNSYLIQDKWITGFQNENEKQLTEQEPLKMRNKQPVESYQHNLYGLRSEYPFQLGLDDKNSDEQNTITESLCHGPEEIWGESFSVPNLYETMNDPKLQKTEFYKTSKAIASQQPVGKKNLTEAEIWNDDISLQAEASGSMSSHTLVETEEDVEAEEAMWKELNEEWSKLTLDDPNGVVDDVSSPSSQGYEFVEENPFKDHPDPYKEGLKKLKEGDVPNAALLFETAVQSKPDHVLAWQYLGITQALNEQDSLALSALRKCVQLDSTNTEAWMALAVSYTNESLHWQAYQALKEWLKNNSKYCHLLREGSSTAGDPFSPSALNSMRVELLDTFLGAAQMNPEGDIDSEVQSGLGVLFSLDCDYDKAADCFKAALQVHPEDCQLWNKLGATLANGNHSEESVEAYKRALSLYPGFIRVRYNIAVSCLNLGASKEAVEHLLVALKQQSSAKNNSKQNPTSENIWTLMRTALIQLGKQDLIEMVVSRNVKGLSEVFDSKLDVS